MSVLIGEKQKMLVYYHPVYIKTDDKLNYFSVANHIFDILNNIKFLTYKFDLKAFVVESNNLNKLIMILENYEIEYHFEDKCDVKVHKLEINEQEAQCQPPAYSTNISQSYQPPQFYQYSKEDQKFHPYPYNERPLKDKQKDFIKGKWQSKVKKETNIQINQIDKDTFSVKFEPFNDQVLQIIKQVEGRVWKKLDKMWNIPATGLDDIKENLQKHSFTYQLTYL
jgi:hypothetical protein